MRRSLRCKRETPQRYGSNQTRPGPLNRSAMKIDSTHFNASRDIHIGLNSALRVEAIPPEEDDDSVDRFDSWYVEKQGVTGGGFYECEGQKYFKENVTVVTAQVENASVRSANKLDVAYGMKAEINPEVQVSRCGLDRLLENCLPSPDTTECYLCSSSADILLG
jgi:hypothetical protein